MDNQAAIELQQKALEHIKTSHAALETARTALDKQAAVEAKVAGLIPGVVQKLIEHGRVYPEYATKLAESLQDPVAMIEMIGELANPATGVRQTIGAPTAPAATKTASAKGPNIIDYRGRPNSADARFEQGITALAGQLGRPVG